MKSIKLIGFAVCIFALTSCFTNRTAQERADDRNRTVQTDQRNANYTAAQHNQRVAWERESTQLYRHLNMNQAQINSYENLEHENRRQATAAGHNQSVRDWETNRDQSLRGILTSDQHQRYDQWKRENHNRNTNQSAAWDREMSQLYGHLNMNQNQINSYENMERENRSQATTNGQNQHFRDWEINRDHSLRDILSSDQNQRYEEWKRENHKRNTNQSEAWDKEMTQLYGHLNMNQDQINSYEGMQRENREQATTFGQNQNLKDWETNRDQSLRDILTPIQSQRYEQWKRDNHNRNTNY